MPVSNTTYSKERNPWIFSLNQNRALTTLQQADNSGNSDKISLISQGRYNVSKMSSTTPGPRSGAMGKQPPTTWAGTRTL